MNAIVCYFSKVRKIRSLGSVPENSYSPPLLDLLNTIGMGLSPKARCVVHLKAQEASANPARRVTTVRGERWECVY